jgi:hypothetical protein
VGDAGLRVALLELTLAEDRELIGDLLPPADGLGVALGAGTIGLFSIGDVERFAGGWFQSIPTRAASPRSPVETSPSRPQAWTTCECTPTA